MKRLLLNGSPRGKDGNSRKLLMWIAQGLEQAGITAPPVVDLAPNPMRSEILQAFLDADEVVFAFPLYTDAMPGIVKAFFELLIDVDPVRLRDKRMAFIIQSGFPEGIHTETLGNYLARVCERLGFRHLGTLRKGGIESIRMLPEKQVAKIQARFVAAGKELGENGNFSTELQTKMSGVRTYGIVMRSLLWLVIRTGLANFYWNTHLKKNGAFAKRFNAPYANPW
jgi:NAD(P)H-dependent FMN reductase